MEPRERVIAALHHEETDFVPYEVGFTSQAHERIAATLGDPNFHNKIGNHLAVGGYHGNALPIPERPGFYRDDFGVVWNRTSADGDIGAIDDIVLKEPTLKDYHLPEVEEAWFRDYFLKQLNQYPEDRFRFVEIGFSMFERAWALRGMQNLLEDMLINESFVDELLGRLCDRNLKIVDIAIQLGVDGIFFGDDWGKQSGMIMGPERWRTLFKPHIARLYARVKSAGKFVAQHSCGDIQEIFGDLIDIGLDAYQTVMPEIYNLSEIKRKFGKNLGFWGAISAQGLLPHGTPQEVKEGVTKTLKIMGAGGGYIAGPTHTITHDVPAENVLAMIDVFQHQA